MSGAVPVTGAVSVAVSGAVSGAVPVTGAVSSAVFGTVSVLCPFGTVVPCPVLCL